MSERTETIEVTEDLVIGEGRDEPEYLFYRALWSVVAPDGRMFVLDNGDKVVKAFDADGEYLFTMGGEGQGPGELANPIGMTISGDRLLVQDNGNQRMSAYSLDGEHLEDTPTAGFRVYLPFYEVPGGGFIGKRQLRPDELGIPVTTESMATRREALMLFRLGSDEETRLIEFPEYEPPMVLRSAGGSSRVRFVRVPIPANVLTSSPDGLYVADTAAYQVHALDADGTARWSLHVPVPREPVTDAEITEALEELREDPAFADVTASEVAFPEHKPVIARVMTDSRGHLYVMLRADAEGEAGAEQGTPRPVDVYDRDGERVFSGWIERGWEHALGDHVYALRDDPETEERTLVRYALRTPF